MDKTLLLRIIYTPNILVVVWISIISIFSPKKVVHSIFENTVAYSEVIKLVGCLWGSIFFLSIIGLFFPVNLSLVLLFQVVYKGSWLLFVVLPEILHNNPYPKGMAVFFLAWVVVLPFVIPWGSLFSTN